MQQSPDEGGPPVNGTLLWSQGVGRQVTSISASADGSYIVVGTHRKGSIALYNNKGEMFWRQDESVSISGVSIAPDGSYVGVAADRLYLLYPHGGVFWVYNSGFFPYSVAVAADGAYVAAGFDDGTACLFSREGDLLWSYPTDENVRSIAITADATSIVAGTDGDHVYMFDGNGGLMWNYECGADVRSVSISRDGTAIAVGSSDRQVYFFDSQGKLLWKRSIGGRINSVSVSPDGSYVAACSENKVVIYDTSGKSLWTYTTDSLGSLASFSSTGSILGVEVRSVALSEYGSYLVVGTGTGDQAIHFFSIFDVDQSREEPEENANSPAVLQRNYFYSPPGDPEETAVYTSLIGITTAGTEDHGTVAVRMAVSPHWVELHDGPGKVSMTRWAGEGSPEIINTTFVGQDLEGRYIFEASSAMPIAKYGVTTETAPGVATDENNPASFIEVVVYIAILVGAAGIGAMILVRERLSVQKLTRYEKLIAAGAPVQQKPRVIETVVSETEVEESGIKADEDSPTTPDADKLEGLIRASDTAADGQSKQ